MSLISCPECGNSISSTASQCIHCGYSMEYYQIILTNPSEVNRNTLSNTYKSIFGVALSEEQINDMCHTGIVWSSHSVRQAKEYARKLSRSIAIVIKDRDQCYVSFSLKLKYTALFIISSLLVWILGLIASIGIAIISHSGWAFFVSFVFFFAFGAVVYGIGEIVNCLRTIETLTWNQNSH